MIAKKDLSVLIDAREFIPGKLTGIGRVIEGLTDALAESNVIEKIILAVFNPSVVPSVLKNRQKINIRKIPASFLKSEKTLSDLSKTEFSLFISPYPKLPLFGFQCRAVHTIHDVLDLTHPAYRKRFRVFFDKFRMKKALKRANLTWFVSSWSMKETKKYVGLTGKDPKVRYSGIDERFNKDRQPNIGNILKKYDLEPLYILVLGNGLPHKNLGVLLDITDHLSRKIVFVGVSQKNQQDWKLRFSDAKTRWIDHVVEEDLPAIIRGAFCLAQPSTAEGYGFPPLEAMACGVPAVVSNIPVLVETTGDKAMIADPEDPKTWLVAFKELENEEIYQNQIEKGLAWVEPLHGRKGWQRHIADIEELLTREDRIQKVEGPRKLPEDFIGQKRGKSKAADRRP